MKNIKFLMSLAVFIFLATAAFAETQFVTQVIDSHTIRLLNGDLVRLIGVDLNQNNNGQTQTEILAQEKKAAGFIRNLVSGSLVELEYDQKKYDEPFKGLEKKTS